LDNPIPRLEVYKLFEKQEGGRWVDEAEGGLLRFDSGWHFEEIVGFRQAKCLPGTSVSGYPDLIPTGARCYIWPDRYDFTDSFPAGYGR
jgi:hypothetical protein